MKFLLRPALTCVFSGENFGNHNSGDSIDRPANPGARIFKRTRAILLLLADCRNILFFNQRINRPTPVSIAALSDNSLCLTR